MKISLVLNGKNVEALISDDRLLIDFLRDHGCLSVKRGCESSNCGLCTVFMDDKPVLSCSVLAARADGHRIDTLEGLQGGRGVRSVHRRPGSGTVRLLQSGHGHERHCHVPGKSGPHGR